MSEPIITKDFLDLTFYFNATPTIEALIHEIFADNYHVFRDKLQFRPGDVIIDAGANEGVFSIFMAKMFPKIHVISLEPVHRTFFQMIRNIGLNGVTNITALNVGVGAPGVNSVDMVVSKVYSGGSSSVCNFNPKDHVKIPVTIVPLDNIIVTHAKDGRIRLLKIDIEGSEYEAIYNCRNLSMVDYVVGEFHTNSRLRSQGFEMERLAAWVREHSTMPYYEQCRMSE